MNLRRPSPNPGVLVDQLVRELERLEKEGESAEEPELYQAYLHYAHSLAWERVAQGDLDAPRRILDQLLVVQPLADAHRPEIPGLLEQASLEVDLVIRSLYLACEALEDKRVEVRLADRRSETEREVLRVLAASGDEYLRRGDVHERLAPEIRPTPARVGQILVELYHDGLLKRIHSRAQGNPNASFYALSPRGLDVCGELGLVLALAAEEEVPSQEAESAASPIDRLVEAARVALDPSQSDQNRVFARTSLANVKDFTGQQILEVLETAATQKEDEKTLQLFKRAVTQVVLAKSIEVESESAFPGNVEASDVTPGVVRLAPPSPQRLRTPKYDFTRIVFSMVTRRDRESVSPSESVLSARDEAAAEAIYIHQASKAIPHFDSERALAVSR